MKRFADKVVMVTGAGSGIGQASAVRIGAEGGAIFCVDINLEAAQATAAQIVADGGSAAAHSCDVSNEGAVAECFSACIDSFGSLYALINMAGILRFDDTEELQLADWQRLLDVNLTGTMLLCRAALPHLIASKGNIVNAASTAALSGLPCGVAYSATKGGVLAMTRSIAVEYAKRGVRANCVCPGDINSGMTTGINFPKTMDFDLMGRIMSLSGAKGPEAISGVIAMLASEDAIHMTGEDVRVDGGTLS